MISGIKLLTNTKFLVLCQALGWVDFFSPLFIFEFFLMGKDDINMLIKIIDLIKK